MSGTEVAPKTRRLVSLAACSTLDAGPLGTIDAARQAGFTSLGLRIDASELDRAALARIRGALDAAGLQLLDFEIIRLAGTGVAAFKPILDAAAELGARYVLTVSDDPDLSRTSDEFTELCGLAAAADVSLAFEFVPFIGVRTVAQAIGIIRASGSAHARLMVDALHLFRSGGQIADLSGLQDMVGYLQLCDAPAVAPSLEDLELEAKHGRLAPGEGNLPLVDLLTAVPDVPVSVEVLSDELTKGWPPTPRAALLRRCTEALLLGSA